MEGTEVNSARTALPKPAPFIPQRPPPSAVPPVLPSAHPMPSNGATPPRPGRKPPPSGPPPPPPRVDLGEAPAEVVSSIKEQRSNDLTMKGSPKLMPKARPEITIVSEKPMDSSGVIARPSAPSRPAPVCEEPKMPQKPGRRSKGREPPPRPKTRPVSELTLETDEKDFGLVVGDGKIIRDREGEEKTSGSKLLKEGSGFRSAPAVPARKVQIHKMEDNDVCREKDNMNEKSNLEEKLEFNQKKEREGVEEYQPVKKIDDKPTENELRNLVEVDAVKEMSSDNPGVPVVDTAPTGKKSKPTVIVAKPKKTPPLSQDPEEQNRSEEQKESSKEEKPIPVTTQERKPPPPAKKPKPAVKPKPSSMVGAPVKEPVEEKKVDSALAPKPKAKPTVILPAKPPRVIEAPKPGSESTKPVKEENLAQVKPSRPTVILPAKPSKMSEALKPSDSEAVKNGEDEQTNLKPTSVESSEKVQEGENGQEQAAVPQTVKPKRVPTVIRAPRPEGLDSGEGRKAPKRPQRGPSVRKVAPPRPVSAPAEENKEQDKLSAGTQEESNTVVPAQVTEKVQEKKPKPPRPVSVPGVQEDETLLDAKKLHEVEADNTFTRKGSRKRPPPPRPPVTEPARGEVETTPEARDKTHDVRSKENHRPPPPRPAVAEPARGEAEPTPEARDKTHDVRSKENHRPLIPRPPVAEPVKGEAEPTPEICDEMHLPNEKSKDKHRPPPRRPPSVEPSRDKADSSPEMQKKHDVEKPNGKSKPPRPSSRVLDNKPSEHLHKETVEGHVEDKPKPARPVPVVPKANAASRNVTETQTVGESSADDHVKDTSVAHDPAQQAGHSTAECHEKAPSKSKPKPPRPASSSLPSKHKPQRPSEPQAKSSKTTQEKAAATQVSSVCKTYIEPSAIAMYDYEPSAMDDLAFSAGDEIVLVKKVDSEWYIGRLGDQQGMFPMKFVEIIEDLPQETAQETQPVAAPASSPFDVMALYDFHGNKHDGELVFNAGEMIHVIEKINDDWLKGEYHGQTGAFPCSFVDITMDVINKLPLSEIKAAPTEPEQVLQCKALFDYNSDVPDDLSFSAGDIIEVCKKIGDEWIEGKLHGQVGMFPSTYVEMVEHTSEENRSKKEETKKSIVEYGTALYDFTGSASDELSFKKGDKIEILEVVGDDWLRGKLGGHEGMFPRSFVQLSKDPVRKAPPVKKNAKVTPKAKALFDFDGEFEDELCFKVDDVIVLLERVNEEWLKGELNSRVGRFPAAFVEVLTPLP